MPSEGAVVGLVGKFGSLWTFLFPKSTQVEVTVEEKLSTAFSSSKPSSFGFRNPEPPIKPHNLNTFVYTLNGSSHPCTSNPPPQPSHPSMGEQDSEEQQQYDSHQYPEEAQGGWDGGQGNTQEDRRPSWDDAQDNWDAAPSCSEASWDADGAQVGQGGWVDGGEVPVAKNRSKGGCGPPGIVTFNDPSVLCHSFYSSFSFLSSL